MTLFSPGGVRCSVDKLLVIQQLRFFNGEAIDPRWRVWMDLPLPREFATHFPIRLTLYSMLTGPDDYDTPSNEIYCPCGETMHWASGSVGEALELSRNHLRKKHGRMM